MPIHFSHEQYETLRKTYRKWWAGELDRPIIPIQTTGYSADTVTNSNPVLSTLNAWDFSIDPQQFIEAADVRYSGCRWHGDAFPHFTTSLFGPGVLAAFLGCTPIGDESTVWFMPPRPDIPIEELHFEYNENNPCYRRVLNLYEAAMEKWHGSVVISMVDMGGILDVLSSFRGAENLLLDLIDSPDEVLRCIKELQECWFIYYNKFNEIMAPEAEGYTQWFRLFGEKPGYILQSDFSYMISPEMFGTFVAPELKSSAARLTNAVYHLDGIGEIPHLDQLLAMDEIKGIQWVPGTGTPSTLNWDELLLKILKSGKKLLYWPHRPDGLPLDAVKDYPGQLYMEEHYWHKDQIDSAKHYGALYGIEVNPY